MSSFSNIATRHQKISRLLLAALGLEIVVLGYLLANSQQTSTESAEQVESNKPTVIISGALIPYQASEEQTVFFTRLKEKFTPTMIVLTLPLADGAETLPIIFNTEDSAPNNLTAALTVKGLAASSSATLDEPATSILSNLAGVFPDAQVLPLALPNSSTKSQLEDLANELESLCPRCLLVVADNLSASPSPQLASLHNQLALDTLSTQDTELLLKKAETQSPPSLALLSLWSRKRQTNQFLLDDNEKRGWFQTGGQKTVLDSVSFIIGGDAFFDRMIAHTHHEHGLWRAFAKIGERIFWGTDAGIINLEGPISPTPVAIDISPNNMSFNFLPEATAALQYLKINGASLANNHTNNAGQTVLENTRQVLQTAGISPFGGPADSSVDKTASFPGRGLTLHLIGVNILAGTPDLTEQIRQIKTDPASRLIIFPHWGAEYQPKHGSSQQRLAHQWIDAGADMIIGSHSHVIQDMEIYQNRPIIYSLGNLLFDQTFSKETQQGILVAGEFSANSLTIFVLSHETVKYQPRLMSQEKSAAIIATLIESVKSYWQTDETGTYLRLVY